ncbi:MAG: DUF7336 domain-containing protein [Tumebacillaceae bacterium]
MTSVFVLQHSYELDDVEETKIIGIFSSREKAEAIVEEYKLFPGFREYPDCFHIDEYVLDRSFWTGGFIKWDEA